MMVPHTKALQFLNWLVLIGAVPVLGAAAWYMPVYVEAARNLPTRDYIQGKFDTQAYIDRQQRRDIDRNSSDIHENSARIEQTKERVIVLCYKDDSHCERKGGASDSAFRAPVPTPHPLEAREEPFRDGRMERAQHAARLSEPA